MAKLKGIVPCLWFDGQAEDAAKLYVSVFPDSTIVSTTPYSEEGFEIHKQRAGATMTVHFRIMGHDFVGLNGGPQFRFDEAISFQIMCDSQREIDHYWSRLIEGGGEEGPCGWLKDRFGLSWQVVPSILPELLQDRDAKKVARVTKAFLQMKKMDIAAIERAAAGA